jgi:hypothetical protein
MFDTKEVERRLKSGAFDNEDLEIVTRQAMKNEAYTDRTHPLHEPAVKGVNELIHLRDSRTEPIIHEK